jgi:hypothetical protein
MSRALDVEELTNGAFQMFYDCLRQLHGTAYADFVLGAPEEVVIEAFPSDRLRASHDNQTCVSCQTAINEDCAEDCMFESVEEGDFDEATEFFMCTPCQDSKL